MPVIGNHTIVHGLLTVLLGLGYAGVVLGLGMLLPQVSSLTVAISTLVLAALLWPAWHRIQGSVNRRFNRRRLGTADLVEAGVMPR
jgi:membrane protein implicated in regulation of membrane protease activity